MSLAGPTSGLNGKWLPGDATIFTKSAGIRAVTDGLTKSERGSYSVRKALLSLAGENHVDAALEHELSDAIAGKLNKATSGIYVPTHINPRASAASLNTLSDGAGKYTVMTEVRDLIELLRNKMRVVQMGATYFSGCTGNISFPRHLTGTTGSWVTEAPDSAVSQVDSTFDAVGLTPKTYQATTAFSRQLLAQSSVDIEAFVRNDLATYHALAVDLAAIAGTGDNNEPTGILATQNIGDVAMGANGAVPTYSKIVDLETNVATANADEAGMKFLTTPGVRGVLRKLPQLDAVVNSRPTWEPGPTPGSGFLNGYGAFVSNQVPSTLTKGASSETCHAIIFGYWPTVLIAEWGVLELIVDPYSLKKKNLLECTSFQMVDVALRHPAQMAAIQDAKLS